MNFMRISFAIAVTSLLSFPTITSAGEDWSLYTIKGDVSQVDIVRDQPTGAYRYSRLLIEVRDEPYPLLVICQGNSNCETPNPTLGTSQCLPLRHEQLIDNSQSPPQTIDVYRCREGARRDAGACVEVSHRLTAQTPPLYTIIFQYYQILFPFVDEIDFFSDCAFKSTPVP